MVIKNLGLPIKELYKLDILISRIKIYGVKGTALNLQGYLKNVKIKDIAFEECMIGLKMEESKPKKLKKNKHEENDFGSNVSDNMNDLSYKMKHFNNKSSSTTKNRYILKKDNGIKINNYFYSCKEENSIAICIRRIFTRLEI